MTVLDRLLMWLERRGPTGWRGERIAARYLKRQGYRILARNLRSRVGEIDILAQAPSPDERTVVVVEVKSGVVDDDPLKRTTRPEQHVNPAKQRKLSALATQLSRKRGLNNRPMRFDVLAVELPPSGDPIIRHHPAAFEATF